MGKTTDMLLDAAQAALDGKPEVLQACVARIRELCVNNAKATLDHFEIPEAEGALALQEVTSKVGVLLGGLDNYLQGVSLLKDLSPRTLDAILSNGERICASVLAAVLSAVVRHFGDVSGSGNSPSSPSPPGALAAKAVKAMRPGLLSPLCVEATAFMCTDDSFGQAHVDFNATRSQLLELANSWPSGTLPVFTGFIGRSKSGATTTLGRNGSDYSAALIAAALRAEQLIINTDVPGVFTADPRLVPDAFPVPKMSYTEAIELSIYGSKIFHPKTMLPLMKHGVPMVIRNTTDAPGAPSTVIKDNLSPLRRNNASAASMAESGSSDEGDSDDGLKPLRSSPPSKLWTQALRSPSMLGVSRLVDSSPELSPRECHRAHVDAKAADAEVGAVCVASLEDLSFITLRAEIGDDGSTEGPEVAVRAMRALAQGKVRCIWSDQRSGNDASILVRRGDRVEAASLLRKEFSDLRLMELSATEPVTLLSLVPKQGASRVAAAARFFAPLSKANVKIHRVVCGASTSSISCVIDAEETGLAVRTIHEAFNFSRIAVSLVILGNNRTARGLLEKLQQMRNEGSNSRQFMDFRVCAVVTHNGPLVLGKLAPVPSDDKPSVALDANGLDLAEVLAALNEEDDHNSAAAMQEVQNWRETYDLIETAVLPGLRRMTRPVLVDCNACASRRGSGIQASGSKALASCYLHCLKHGIRLAVSNSATLNVFAGALRHFSHGQAQSSPSASTPLPVDLLQQRRGLLRYDSATAAGLPLLQAIRDQLYSGKRVSVVQGTFSATLGLILDRVSRGGLTLREATEEAYKLGITEPLITSDLAGLDTVEKLRVVAFSMGIDLPEDCVELQPLVPMSALEGAMTVAAVFEALDVFDKAEKFSQRAAAAFQAGRRWRFIATLELHAGPDRKGIGVGDGHHGRATARAKVRVEEVGEDHFAFPNRGQEIACALWEDFPFNEGDGIVARTSWGGAAPLVLRGPGAGKAAGEGALSDVVRLVDFL
ncbi:unnamed protein product [Polarella glacialis]|uniref:aspartate kinase n=1 Tax=Polarella glacialis TaxID=89957 RepID=A0A813IB45_POLGL|nr:unnamed protein product [Polarella glacialis]